MLSSSSYAIDRYSCIQLRLSLCTTLNPLIWIPRPIGVFLLKASKKQPPNFLFVHDLRLLGSRQIKDSRHTNYSTNYSATFSGEFCSEITETRGWRFTGGEVKHGNGIRHPTLKHREIAIRCPENISSVVKVSSCSY